MAIAPRGYWAISARVGNANGQDWSAPICLVNLADSTDLQIDPLSRGQNRPSQDGGYPSTVVAPSGIFVTAYYCKGIPQHRRYHMGIVRWRWARPSDSGSPPRP